MQPDTAATTGIVRARNRRARSGRAAVTDQRILEAALEVIRARGWGGTSVFAVAKQAGLSSGAVTDRHPTISDLGVAVWRGGVGEALGQTLVPMLQAALPLPGSGEEPHGTVAVSALRKLARPDQQFEVAVQLLCATPFDEAMRSAIASDIQGWVAPWYETHTPAGRVRAAQAVYLLVCALGLLLARRRPGASKVDLAPAINRILEALESPAPATALPDIEASQMRLDPVGPPILDDYDALLAATILQIADNGYEQSTLSRIVASVGVTQGMVFSRHKTKAELFVAAILWRTAYALKGNAEWTAELAKTLGPGLAEAVTWREYLRPEHKRGRTLALEQVRVGWHEPDVQAQHDAAEAGFAQDWVARSGGKANPAMLAEIHLDLAIGYGAVLLPELLPDAWTLPLDVVTVALLNNA